jgi:type IV pilus assembly protein PilE
MSAKSGLDPSARRVRGFTLIELMIAVAVIAIIAAVALPTYNSAMRKSRRADAIAALSAVQMAQERWRANNPAYTGELTAAATATPPGLGLPSSQINGALYTVTVENVGASSYTAVATAVSGTSQADDGNCARLRVRVDVGNIFYGSASSGGSFDESAGNRCWSR